MTFHFIANLKPYLVRPGRGGRRFDGYLISADYMSAPNADLVTEVARKKCILCADNGNVDNITAMIDQFLPKTAALQVERKREEKALGRYARPGDLSTGLRDRFRAAAREIAAASKGASNHRMIAATASRQASIRPNYMIGMEDFTISTLAGCSIEPEYSGLPLSWYESATKRAIKRNPTGPGLGIGAGASASAGAGAGPGPLVFAGLHAIDFDTARQAGRLAGEANAQGIATGMAGVLADRNSTDFRIENRQVIELGATATRPYLRVVEIAAGMHIGFAQATGKRPRFHALGAGSPILLPLLSLMSDKSTFMATDSLAPVLDAWSSKTISLYIERPAALKLKAHLIAQHWMDEGLGWICTCPHCRRFNAAHPARLGKARTWWKGEGRRDLTPSDMHAPSPLAEFMPLLAYPQDRALRQAAALARVGHNHWILRRLETNIRKRAGSLPRLREWVAGEVAAYEKASNAPLWRVATRAAWQLADKTAVDLKGAKSGGSV